MVGGSPHPQIAPGSPSFRLACYEQFHWTPDVVARLPYTEALLISIYFEESGAYQYRKNKELEQQSSGGYRSDAVVLAKSDDDPDEAVYAEIEEPD